MYLGEPDLIPMLKPYIERGILVDVMLSEPHLFDPTTRVVTRQYKGEVQHIQYSPQEVREAQLFVDSFLMDPIAASLAKLGLKMPFQQSLTLTWNNVAFTIPTQGEGDLVIANQLGGDIKVDASASEKEFVKKVEAMGYHAQGTWYMENFKLPQYVISGIAHKGKLVNGYYPVFHYVIERGDIRHRKGLAWCSEWAYKYLETHFLLDSVRH